MKNKIAFTLLMILLGILFIGTRLGPLREHTTAYTYDQGRDFLKAAEIVDQHDITLLGPTTGIIGLYHGAWWYYFLSVPYALFRGEPIGFYQFNLIIQTITFLVLAVFVSLEAGLVIGLLAALLVIAAPYFAHNSLFVANNILAAPNFLFLLITLFYMTKKERSPFWLMFLSGLFFGLVAEFELSFGIFLVPGFILTVLVFPILRKKFLQVFNSLFFMLGAGIAFLPRFLFELRHGFSQTRVLIDFIFQPKLHNSKAYWDVFTDRLNLFKAYYQSLFAHSWVLWILTLSTIITLVIFIRKRKIPIFLRVWAFFLAALFALSTLYKETFWDNYYEGIQYLMFFLAIFPLSLWKKNKLALLSALSLCLVMVSILVPKALIQSPSQKLSGLGAEEKIISYLYEENPKQFCVDIYTPPAIPYTYRYLFQHENLAHKRELPTDTWTDQGCWYILEPDQYPERRQNWVDNRIPKEARLIKKTQIAGTDIQLWRK